MRNQSLPGSSRTSRATAAQRARWVKRCHRSGLSVAAFADKHGLNVWTLRGWIARANSQTPLSTRPRIQELKLEWPEPLARTSAEAWVVEVQWSSGTVVRLGRGFDARQTKSLFRAIRKVC